LINFNITRFDTGNIYIRMEPESKKVKLLEMECEEESLNETDTDDKSSEELISDCTEICGDVFKRYTALGKLYVAIFNYLELRNLTLKPLS